MSEFGYLSVLLSIIYGLAITHLLQGWRNAILCRARVQEYWPIHVWAFFLLMVISLSWWVAFGLRDQHDWEFDAFAVLLTHAIALYLAAGLLYPDFGASDTVDLRQHYFTNHRYLFCMMAITVTMTFARMRWFHALTNPVNVGFLTFYLIVSVLAVITSNETFHKLLAVIVAASFVVCIAILFLHLH